MSSSRFIFFLAETSTMTVSPPHASGMRPSLESCCLTWSELASGRSILLMATRMGTSAAFAWLMASSVWGMTPSLAATTMTAMSVDLRAAGPHGGERLVARGVEEGDPLLVVRDLVGADVLGDAAGLGLDHLGLPDGVQEGGLAVVDVAHDGDHGRPRA